MPPATSCATARQPSRTAGKRTAAIRLSPSRSRSRRCSPRQALAAAGETAIADYLTATADGWNEQIDDWAYAKGTEIARKLGIDGYYMRIGYSSGDANARSHGLIPIKNRPDGNEALQAGLLISPDALALVRFGLRAA